MPPSRASLVIDRRYAEAMAEEAIARMLLEQQRTKAGSPYAEYVDDPVGFSVEVLGDTLWSKQTEILESVRDNRRTAVPSAHETSKSFTAARTVAWWISTHPFGEAFAVTTAPTATQVKSILWREISRAYRRTKLPGRLNQTEWYMTPLYDRYTASRGPMEELVAFGRKPSDYDETSFQGIHARYVLVILDESCGIPESIWRAVASLAGNDNSRLLAIGNPDISSSYFAKICKPGSGWHVIEVDGLKSPNFTEEKADMPEAVLEQLLGPTYVNELCEEVGDPTKTWEEQVHPIFLAKVRGRFAEDDPMGVVPLSFVRQCQDPEKVHPPTALLPVEIGMDVGAGGDETNLRERRGVMAGRSKRALTPNWADAVIIATDFIEECRPTIEEHGTRRIKVKIDSNGIGWGVHGRLKELYADDPNTIIVAVNVGKASTKPEMFPKLRDQLWWEVGRGLSRAMAWDLRDVDERTIGQLISPQYTRETNNRIKIEPKAETRKRLQRSPDDADSLILAYANVTPEAADVGSEEIEREIEREREERGEAPAPTGRLFDRSNQSMFRRR